MFFIYIRKFKDISLNKPYVLFKIAFISRNTDKTNTQSVVY